MQKRKKEREEKKKERNKERNKERMKKTEGIYYLMAKINSK